MQALPPSQQLAELLVRADSALRAHVTVPAALEQQRIVLRLSGDAGLSRTVIRLLPPRLARDVTDDVLAHRELARLTPPRLRSAFRVGPAAAAERLRDYYREAERRSGVDWEVLAAVNYVESDFGRLREASVSGALGPMQFLPSTWAAYGRGDVHDPHAAILGAARFLRAAGSARDERGALHRYNPSWAYVDAVERYAGRIRRDPLAYRIYYARRLIVRTPTGLRRLN